MGAVGSFLKNTAGALLKTVTNPLSWVEGPVGLIANGISNGVEAVHNIVSDIKGGQDAAPGPTAGGGTPSVQDLAHLVQTGGQRALNHPETPEFIRDAIQKTQAGLPVVQQAVGALASQKTLPGVAQQASRLITGNAHHIDGGVQMLKGAMPKVGGHVEKLLGPVKTIAGMLASQKQRLEGTA